MERKVNLSNVRMHLLLDSGNEGRVIGDFGEKARKLFEADKISEGHYRELLHKIGIDGSED